MKKMMICKIIMKGIYESQETRQFRTRAQGGYMGLGASGERDQGEAGPRWSFQILSTSRRLSFRRGATSSSEIKGKGYNFEIKKKRNTVPTRSQECSFSSLSPV